MVWNMLVINFTNNQFNTNRNALFETKFSTLKDMTKAITNTEG